METLSVEQEVDIPSGGEVEKIHWKQLWSLAALYGSIIVGWIAYQNYQPRLLVRFGFTDFAFMLLAVQAVVLVATPPIAGRLGDRFRASQGSRLPIISSGISLAAMIFMAVAFTLLGDPGAVFRWILPVLIVGWLIAMSIFTSPALSTVELFTPVDKLPRAMAVLTIVSNLIYSLEPVIVDIIDYVGAPLTFMAGGVAVFFSGLALRRNSLGLFRQTGNREPGAGDRSVTTSSYSYIFFMGLVLGLATALMFNLIPARMEAGAGDWLGEGDGKILLVAMLLSSALLSWPVSGVANAAGVQRVFWISFAALVPGTALLLYSTSMLTLGAMLILFVLAFTALSVSGLPLAIRYAADREKVFCVGLFFSGAALPEGLAEAFQAWP